MSHRYRVAFKETLCGKRHGYHKSNGFSREAQSSVRESMISSTGGYDPHLVSFLFLYLYFVSVGKLIFVFFFCFVLFFFD